MKRIAFPLIALLFVLVSGCKKDDAGSGTDPFGGGGGGGGGVTFQVTVVRDQQNQPFFQFTPSTPVTVTQVTATLQGAQPNVLNGDGTTVYSAQNPFVIGPVTGLAAGQQWSFVIQGKIGNAQGAAYNVTTNFVVP